MTQGAVMRSWRSAARKVSVRQRPCGTLAIRRAPRLQRPCRRVMLVLAQVSSMNTRRLGSSRPWCAFHRGTAASDVGAILLAGVQAFFKRDPVMLEEAPDRP